MSKSSEAFRKLMTGEKGVVLMTAIMTRGGNRGYVAIHDVRENDYYTVEFSRNLPTDGTIKTVQRASVVYRMGKTPKTDMPADLLRKVIMSSAQESHPF